MAPRTRRVAWTESARQALDDAIAYIVSDSPDRALDVLTRSMDAAQSLSTFAGRGRVVREVADTSLRELLIDDYRIIYRVHDTHVVIRAFLHGARDFATWQREQERQL